MADKAVKFTVLIVDDEADVRAELEEYFQHLGCEVLVADGGERAFQVAAETPPDVVITDIRMPGVDGYEVIAHFAEQKTPPVVFAMTGHSSNPDIERARASGARQVFEKPFNLEEIYRAAMDELEKR